MQKGDSVLVKSIDGVTQYGGTVTHIWTEQFVRVQVVRASPIDDVEHHDYVDVPVGGPVEGYDLYVEGTVTMPQPASAEQPAAPEGSEAPADDGRE